MNPLLKPLSILIGEWTVEISGMSFRDNPLDKVTGAITFKWLDNGPFIIQYSKFDDREFPSGIEIIGLDDTNKNYSVLYSDDRNVLRIYEMTLEKNVWKEWRTAPDFSQRFTGIFENNNSTITAKWESSKDNIYWEHDFDLIFNKINKRN